MKYLKEELLDRDDLGFCGVYAAFLFFREKPQLNRELLYQNMEKFTGSGDAVNGANIGTGADVAASGNAATSADTATGSNTAANANTAADKEKKGSLMVYEPNSDEGPLILFHLNHLLNGTDGTMPAQTCITADEDMRELPDDIFAQAWDLPGAKETFGECRYCVSQVLMICPGMDYKERLQLFRSALAATLETVPCDIMYWQPSMKLVDPARFRETFDEDPLYGAFNTRMYNMAGSGEKQAVIMDTCGLSGLGLPDLQCHFYDLDPNDLAGRFYDLAHYIFEAGDVIEDGNTVFSEYWKCQHEYAIAVPRRQVLDVNPGEPFYAG